MAGTETNTIERFREETRDELRAAALRATEEAKEILEFAEAERRELTDAERERVDDLLLRAEGLNARLQRVKKRATFSATMDDVNRVFNGGTTGPTSKALRTASWGAAVVNQCMDGIRYKGLTPAGSALVEIPAPEPVAQGRPVASLRSLIPAEDNGGIFAFLRQDAREQNAAPVATGSVKPTSRFEFTRIQDRARVIAHLSEPIPRQDLADAPLLQDFISTEMGWGLEMALEDQILNGDGVGENFAGLAVTAGVQTVARLYPTDDYGLFLTLRRGITRLESLGLEGTGWVMNPSDWESVETAVTDDGSMMLTAAGQTVPIDRAARRLYGLPVISTPSAPAGVVWLADWQGSTKLYVREEARIDWSENTWDPGAGASDYARNLLRFRVEGRFGLGVLRPSGLVKISLT